MENLKQLISIPSGQASVEGMLEIPEHPLGIVLFAHGSGSSRFSPRNNYVARTLRSMRMGTLMLDLLTPQEDQHYQTRFDIALLTGRLAAALEWLDRTAGSGGPPLGLFGASTGAAAALQVAGMPGAHIAALVSRGGRPDLAGNAALERVQAPTLLIVGGEDKAVLDLNKHAYDTMHCEKRLAVVPGASHLFEEPGALEEVAELAGEWLGHHFALQRRPHPR